MRSASSSGMMLAPGSSMTVSIDTLPIGLATDSAPSRFSPAKEGGGVAAPLPSRCHPATPLAPMPDANSPPATPPLYLVDGSSYIFRAYHRLPPLTNRHG